MEFILYLDRNTIMEFSSIAIDSFLIQNVSQRFQRYIYIFSRVIRMVHRPRLESRSFQFPLIPGITRPDQLFLDA